MDKNKFLLPIILLPLLLFLLFSSLFAISATARSLSHELNSVLHTEKKRMLKASIDVHPQPEPSGGDRR
ncbi:hypothetical protein O6P43_016919 [Quillaja saponaria]|uniref:Uncharacterized protein n=1 Tax=Quillaja saponaria TaxID=32244 RepID=A0AAD7LQF0_QUISA|nr:hypothetical protein O6P43_016919 [Quillaja saponaria]